MDYMIVLQIICLFPEAKCNEEDYIIFFIVYVIFKYVASIQLIYMTFQGFSLKSYRRNMYHGL